MKGDSDITRDIIFSFHLQFIIKKLLYHQKSIINNYDGQYLPSDHTNVRKSDIICRERVT